MTPSLSPRAVKLCGASAALPLLLAVCLGIDGLCFIFTCILSFIIGFGLTVYVYSRDARAELNAEFRNLKDESRLPRGLPDLVQNAQRFGDKSIYEQINSMTNSPNLDYILEEILNYVIRDYVEYWYKNMSDDSLVKESLKRTARRSIASLSYCMKKVDWVPFMTRHVVDDFASHLRLYRMARENVENANSKKDKEQKGDTEKTDFLSQFFDLELEMEKNLCRDLLSTTPHYENAYLHDLTDILLYLIMPQEDFRCRPLRFLLREVIVRCMLIPFLDKFSDPNEMNQLLVWLLSEVSPRPEDFVICIENSKSVDELDAIYNSIIEEKTILRGKDSGGEHGIFIKQQLGSLDYIETLIKRKMTELTDGITDGSFSGSRPGLLDDNLIQLPIHVVLTNSVAVSYFIDYLQTVGGQNYIDCYLAIEGFKISVEHQLRSLASGETVDTEVYETIKEAAQFMFQQYLSQEAITRVPLDEGIVSKFLSRLRNEHPSDIWFDPIQDKIVEILNKDEHFYPAFKRSPVYVKMLAELGIISEDERAETPLSDTSSAVSVANSEEKSERNGKSQENEKIERQKSPVDPNETITNVVVETLGIGQQGKQSFALYNVRVTRTQNGKRISGWNVLRRYSDFHTFHTSILQKYPKLATLSFPGKKTFNNLDAHFLEKRTKALNQFMESILQPSVLAQNPQLDRIVFDFLSQKEYVGTKDPITKKVMSAMFDPIKNSVKAVGSTVMAVPDQVFDGVSKVGAGINSAARTIIKPLDIGISRPNPVLETDRVAAAITDDNSQSDNIPLRVMLLFVDEVFGVRARNAWFRRQMVSVLRQFVTPFGTSINRRIIDIVNWLTCEQQVACYLASFRDSFWPNGKLAEEPPKRPAAFHYRTRILARSLMLSSLPDELRIVLGAETTYQGISTISDALQNPHLNRRLLYVLLERLLKTIFPQNRFDKIFAQLHSKSPRSKRM
ncbi:hypothetical protein WR25_24393 [Diploscapter pachys]|uniref:PXA domain-containing protein n=1 Tax=Diploscapter pachys TaxID=2018661 RepID=A0A2A2LT71_9BILA|nr:hypothetical protein WR25_24393 [Diploscapter pachys]